MLQDSVCFKSQLDRGFPFISNNAGLCAYAIFAIPIQSLYMISFQQVTPETDFYFINSLPTNSLYTNDSVVWRSQFTSLCPPCQGVLHEMARCSHFGQIGRVVVGDVIIYKSAKTHVKEKRACKSFSLVGFLQEQPVERRENANSCCHHQVT